MKSKNLVRVFFKYQQEIDGGTVGCNFKEGDNQFQFSNGTHFLKLQPEEDARFLLWMWQDSHIETNNRCQIGSLNWHMGSEFRVSNSVQINIPKR